MKKLKLLAITILAVAAASSFLTAATPTVSTGGEFNGLKNTCKEYHITAKETNTLVSQNARLYYIMYNCSNAGTTWSLTVQDKQGTPSILYTLGTLVASTAPVIVAIPPPGALMSGGVDIITGGTTAGVMDLWACYR